MNKPVGWKTSTKTGETLQRDFAAIHAEVNTINTGRFWKSNEIKVFNRFKNGWIKCAKTAERNDSKKQEGRQDDQIHSADQHTAKVQETLICVRLQSCILWRHQIAGFLFCFPTFYFLAADEHFASCGLTSVLLREYRLPKMCVWVTNAAFTHQEESGQMFSQDTPSVTRSVLLLS